MRRIYAFLLTSLDGYYADPDGGLEWFRTDDELERYSRGQADAIDTIVMGRRTFEMMASYWPTEEASREDPVVVGFMNDLPKIVASRTLSAHPWGPTTFVADDVAGHLAAVKRLPGKDIAIFGSSTLVGTLLPTGVVDELRVVVNPVVLGAGRSVFAGAADPVGLRRSDVRQLGNGNVLLTYRPDA
ncbi:dihydrofolate reductase [Georgenia yuyongxinii]|uniref:Dihydrofolate reductase n=1 Tax=Georgenia yuyongxinii TaxID=2589797 RepID=A0A5B8C1C4_9MICO|nr:dihydrofolate reductase family protein [Georgenia yuyongxinii]QDC24258.1 dihydrofolate reductase [Georgenia yuyongxinii]